MSLLRPGTLSRSAFGIALSVATDNSISASAQATATVSEASISQHQNRRRHQPSTASVASAVAASKNQVLYLVERHAVVVVVGEPGGAKADQVSFSSAIDFAARLL